MALQTIADRAFAAYQDGRRLIAPLLGFPGIQLAETDIKTAQQNHRMHVQVIQKLAERFSPDVMFPLMDLSVEANALGRYTIFPREDSATVIKDHFDYGEIQRLRKIDITADCRVENNAKTVQAMRRSLSDSAVIGAYVVGPFSLAALILGAERAAMATIEHPDELAELTAFCQEVVSAYANLLIDAGADAVCFLEPTAVMLGPIPFERYSARHIQKLAAQFAERGVCSIYHICGNSMHLVERMGATGVHALSLDAKEFGVDILKATQLVPDSVAIIGNASPTTTMLMGSAEDVRREVVGLLDLMKRCPNYILSTGCDLPQGTPLENIDAFMSTGREYRCQ